jgi:hypothetical protein
METDRIEQRKNGAEISAADDLSEELGLTTPGTTEGHTDYYIKQQFPNIYRKKYGIGNTKKVHTLFDNDSTEENFKGPGKRLRKQNTMTRNKISRILDNAELTVKESEDPAKALIFVGQALQRIGIKIDQDELKGTGGRRTRRNRKSRKRFKRNHRKSRR